AWEVFTAKLAAELNGENFPDFLRGPWSKLRGYCARLALIVQCLRWAADGNGAEDGDVNGDSVDAAAELVCYFQSQARKVYAVMDADPRVADARRVLKWVRQAAVGQFTRRDAHQALRGTFATADAIDEPLMLLARHNYIRPLPPPDAGGPGRRPSPVYEV